MSDDEEMVAVCLDNDYYLGAGFVANEAPSAVYPQDYLVPRSQLERWKAAKAAYEDMQSEIDQVMDEQRERVMALRRERQGPKGPMAQLIELAYGQRITDALQAPATFRRMAVEDDTPWLATDAKIDRWEEEQGL